MSLHSPTRNVPLATQAVVQMRQLIADGEWPVGSKIPGEFELARAMGISRGTIREALRSLVHAGLLESRAGDGTYVVSGSEIQAVLRRQIGRYRVEEVYEVRDLLEVRGARLAAMNADEADLSALRASLSARNCSETTADYVRHEVEFHRALLRASKNQLLADMHESIDDLAGHISDMVSTLSSPFAVENSELNLKHDALVDAISARDPDLAERIASEIIQLARRSHASGRS
ncbi:FadR/GntR family transcriptional regulator [Leucobacter sp. GX0328]